MRKLHKCFQSIAVLLVLYIVCGMAIAAPTPTPTSKISLPLTSESAPQLSTLDKLANGPAPFPACRNTDDYWYQKSGPDLVTQVPVKPKAMILQADQITGQESGAHYAQGNVVGYQDGKTMSSDWMVYNQATQHATAGGNVVLTRQYDEVMGKWMDYYMDLDSGTLKQATILHNETTMYATADEANVLNKKQYQLTNAYMTSCDPNDPAWHIHADTASMDYYNNQVTANNMKLYAESIPVISMPYFDFPLGTERKSGFLMPELPSMQQNAAGTPQVMMGMPYYWNMAPNYDMTIEPKIYTANGFLISDQFRYKSESGGGIMYTEQVPNDWVTHQSRYYYSLTDTHNLMESITVGYDYNQVSDSNYFVDFGNIDSVANQINLPSDVYANYNPSWGNAQIKIQGYQTLNPTGSYAISQNVTPVAIYETLPQATLNVKPQPIAGTGLNIDLKTQYSNFTSNTALGSTPGTLSPLQSGERTVVYPSLTYPMQNSWGFVKPKFGYDYTNYQLSPYPGVQTDYSSTNLGIPITALDTGLTFERPITLGNSSYAQTLEPRLYYLYVPQVNQSNLPVFDTAPATYNINQLFSENRFSGYDRTNNANDVTMGLTSRLINDNTGVEFANYGIGYRYFITPENTFLYGKDNLNNPQNQAQLFLPEPNLIGEIANHWSNTLSTNANVQYSTIYQNLTAYAAQLMYNPEEYKVLNARFSYTYQMPLLYYTPNPIGGQTFNSFENQYAVDISGQWPIYGNRWLLEGRTNYDFTVGSMLNFIGGVEYNGGCWALRAAVADYVYNVNVSTGPEYYLQFELKGIGSVGPMDATGPLKTNIPGYMPTNFIH